MRNINNIAEEALAALGGRGEIDAVARIAIASISEADYRSLTFPGFKHQLREALRARNAGGLPKAVSVDKEYVQTSLLSVDDFRKVCRSYSNRSGNNMRMRDLFRDECIVLHGVDPTQDFASLELATPADDTVTLAL